MKKKFRVCIPTAGTGSRVKKISNNLNKSLLPINNKAAISHIIEYFPSDCEFVIPIGFKGSFVKQYLKLAHPERKFFFVNIEKYDGKGSGLGLTLIKSKKYLQCPFIFISCDTLIKGKVKKLPDHNWVAYSSKKLSNQYRKIEFDRKKNFVNFLKKNSKKKKNCKNYIGLAGINNYMEFWKSMESNKNSISEGEVFGIKSLKKNSIKTYRYDWYDIGNLESYKINKTKLNKTKENINILEKEKECIWFSGNLVIKYFENQDIIKRRLLRTQYLKNYIPKILDKKKNMYSYKKFEGEIFSKINSKKIFLNFLNHLKKFHKIDKHIKKNRIFQKNCMNFYKKKTLSRILLFYKKFKIKDNKFSINNSQEIYLKDVLNQLDWKYIADGIEGIFHGDLHFENILYSKKNKKFCFLDWRQDFNKSIKYGDINYDFAKLLHGLIVSHESVAKKKFFIKKKKNQLLIGIKNKKIYAEYINIYCKWLRQNNYDVRKIKILSGLIFLNICGLHHYPYSIFLYYLGKKILIEELNI